MCQFLPETQLEWLALSLFLGSSCWPLPGAQAGAGGYSLAAQSDPKANLPNMASNDSHAFKTEVQAVSSENPHWRQPLNAMVKL